MDTKCATVLISSYIWKQRSRQEHKESEVYMKGRMIRENIDRLEFQHIDTQQDGTKQQVPVVIRIRRKPKKPITKINPQHIIGHLTQHMSTSDIRLFMRTLYQKQCPKGTEEDTLEFLHILETGKPMNDTSNDPLTVENTTISITVPKRS